jgi:hypothetical protein
VAGTATNPIVSSNILELPNGAATTPALVFANSTTNGLYSNASTVDCFAFGGTDSDCMGGATVGIKISSTGAYGFTQGSSASGTLGQSIGVAGSGATEVINPSTFLLLPQCKITSAITIGSTSSPVTICSFTLPNSAQTWAYQCTGTYQTSTSAITLTLGTEFSHAPTVSNHNAQIWSAATSTFAGPITNTGTTAVTTLTGAAPASSTSVPWSASGSFTGNATSGTFILYGLASTASDAQINAGSTCQIY